MRRAVAFCSEIEVEGLLKSQKLRDRCPLKYAVFAIPFIPKS